MPFTPEKFLKVEHGLTVLNKYAPGPNYYVLARKYWHNLADTDQRPNYTLVLKQNGEVMDGKQKEMIPPAYIHMWTSLPLYQTGTTPYNYSVDEVPVPNGYVLTVKMGFQTIRTASGNIEFPDPHTWEIHNEYTGGPNQSVTGTKIWQGGSKPDVWFKLQRKTEEITVHDVPGAELKPINATTLTATWENLPTYAITSETYVYSIVETDDAGNPLTLAAYDSTYSEDGLTVTNSVKKQGNIIVDLFSYPAVSETQKLQFQTTGTDWLPFELAAADAPNEQILKPGVYSINQVKDPTLPLLDAFCESSIENKEQNSEEINLEDDETVKCSFINALPNSIAVKKVTASESDEQFTFNGAIEGIIGNLNYLVKADVAPDGTLWSVSEKEKVGWVLDSINCHESNVSDGLLKTEVRLSEKEVLFGLDEGEVILCTFVNKQIIVFPDTGFPVGRD